ncbi:response regulator transcription factor [Aminiphilus sp.]|uniref:response regulator transcription factor n=1 Tax=Aminiphilus sp. TaxID=1872488 RepID=UPI002613FC0D|nr:response regulator transcription factor [Aminiphilus sp.]
MAVSVLLADDHPLTRSGIAAFLREQAPELELVGEAEDGAEAWRLLVATRPQIALLDIRMPGEDGIALVRKLRAEGVPTRAIMLTAYNAQGYVLAALAAGAKGFVVKSSAVKELQRAIDVVMSGGMYLDSQISRVVGAEEVLVEPLTEREREVLLLASRGLSMKETGAVLHIAERTVQAHLGSAYGKLGAKNKTEALLLAIKHGMLLLDELLEDGEP